MESCPCRSWSSLKEWRHLEIDCYLTPLLFGGAILCKVCGRRYPRSANAYRNPGDNLTWPTGNQISRAIKRGGGTLCLPRVGTHLPLCLWLQLGGFKKRETDSPQDEGFTSQAKDYQQAAQGISKEPLTGGLSTLKLGGAKPVFSNQRLWYLYGIYVH